MKAANYNKNETASLKQILSLSESYATGVVAVF
jgi:hypothetical protein